VLHLSEPAVKLRNESEVVIEKYVGQSLEFIADDRAGVMFQLQVTVDVSEL
jgi:hypothetical protein